MKLIGFKEWKINERIMIRFNIQSVEVGFYFGSWIHIYLLPFMIFINTTEHPMYGEENDVE